MDNDILRINLTFEIEGCSREFLEEVREFLNFKGEIDNKKFIEFFSIDKRPLLLANYQKNLHGQTHGISDVYSHYLTQIDIAG